MRFAKAFKTAAALAAASLAFSAPIAQSQSETVPRGGNWNTVVAKTESGHRIGNPEAKIKLIEFVSYTCSHCATFTREGEGALQLAYIGPGRLNLEVRHIVRDPLDLTAAMLANCGDPSQFPLNHTTLMLSQKDWLPIARTSTQAQRQRWNSGAYTDRRRAIASDFGFYDLMERRGYRVTDIDRCLADDKLATELAAASSASLAEFQIAGTPSFAIDGTVLLATHDWSALETQLSARF